MKKRVLALIMSTAMIASVLTACGGSDETTKTEDKATTTEKTENKDAASDSSSTTDVSAATGEIKVWVAENVVSLTQEKAEAFKAANPEYAGFTVTIEPVGEGDAAGNMITDVEGGADIYGFAQDQIARLVSAGALMPLSGDNATFVAEKNDAGAVGAATVGDTVYAFPITSDNGYFLYYDKSVVNDPSTLEGIVADCEAAGKGVYFEINSAWYQTAFFFGTGCELTYDTDSDGNFVGCNVSYASDAGVKALKAMINLHKSSAFNNGSNISNAANVGAIVDGTWDATAAKGIFGDNYACAKLPTFTVDGETFQMSGFGGFKLLGVKPQTDAAKLQACLALAKYLSDEEVQLARFEALGWGPSNLAAQQNEAVKSDEALSALAEQLAFTIPQGNYPGDYWTLGTSLGDSVIAGDYDNASDADLMAALESFQTSCKSYAGQ
ncbi:MAG: extracellular solute-binding protein [Lachnospiraceae bacterium]|nr:extracellular solute-binding protein [Lachnospiraceae bacterium]